MSPYHTHFPSRPPYHPQEIQAQLTDLQESVHERTLGMIFWPIYLSAFSVHLSYGIVVYFYHGVCDYIFTWVATVFLEVFVAVRNLIVWATADRNDRDWERQYIVLPWHIKKEPEPEYEPEPTPGKHLGHRPVTISLPVELLARTLGHMAQDHKGLTSAALVSELWNLEAERVLYHTLIANRKDDVWNFYTALKGRRARQLLVQHLEIEAGTYEDPHFSITTSVHFCLLLGMVPRVKYLRLHLSRDAMALIAVPTRTPPRDELEELVITTDPFEKYSATKFFVELHPALKRLHFTMQTPPRLPLPGMPVPAVEPEVFEPLDAESLKKLEEISGPVNLIRLMVPDHPVTNVNCLTDVPDDIEEANLFWEALGQSTAGVRTLSFRKNAISSSMMVTIATNLPDLQDLSLVDIDPDRLDASRFVAWGYAFKNFRNLKHVHLRLRDGDPDILFMADCEEAILTSWSVENTSLESVAFACGQRINIWSRLGMEQVWVKIFSFPPEGEEEEEAIVIAPEVGVEEPALDVPVEEPQAVVA